MSPTTALVCLAVFVAAHAAPLGAQGQPGADSVFTPEELTERPTVVWKPPAIRGDSTRVFKRVVVRFVLDTSGRAEPGSMRIAETADSGLDAAAEQYVVEMVFRPARADHRAVRALVDLPVWLPTTRVETAEGSAAAVPDSSAAAVPDTSVHRAGEVGKPEIIWGPPLRYPEDLRRRSIEGRVLVQAIVDTSGRAEPQSVRVLRSADPGFDGPAKAWVLGTHFRPAYLHGRPVRVLVQVPIDFRIRSR